MLSTTQDENSTWALNETNDSTNAMPASCCTRDSDYKNNRCEKYYINGCSASVQEFLSANVMVASFLALGMALFDVCDSNILHISLAIY